MSTVSRAHDEVLDRPVALKLLKPAFSGDPEFVERFYGEARAAARIVHPHIVSIFDVLQESRACAVVMEYVDGTSIAGLLRANGRIGEAETIAYGRATAQALAAAHAQGVVHRDLKPGNVLLTADGCLKVADFGLGAGTPEYASPEQLAGGTPEPAWDLYSLGAVMLAMTAGAAGPRLQQVLARLTDANPAQRYASAEDVDAALAAIQDRPAESVFVESPTLLSAPPVRDAMLRQAQHDTGGGRHDAGGGRHDAGGARLDAARMRARAAALATGVGAAVALGLERLRAVSERHVEPHTDRAFAVARVADRRYFVVAGAVACLVLFLLAGLDRPRVALADLRHSPVGAARERLRADGLTAAEIAQADETVPRDRIIRQDPAPGTPLRRGDTVRLVISSGLPMVAVPNLLGQTLAQANAVMTRAKLHPKYAAKITDDAPNTVIQEIPAPGNRVRERGQVLVIVSTGPHPRYIYTGGGDGGD